MASAVHAEDIYRWVDEKGRTQFSDKVPERYRNAASRVDTSPAELTESQRLEAAGRAAREKEVVQRASEARNEPAQPSAAVVGGRDRVTQQKANCERMQREYRESQECFAPYIVRGRHGKYRPGVVLPEAFLHCKPVPDPSQQCGSPPQYTGQ